LPCEAWRDARWCFGGIAELVSDIEDGIAEGAIAAGGAVRGAKRGPDSADPPGFGPAPPGVLYGVSPGPPGFGPGVPTELPPLGLVACAHAGAENASAATTATPVKK
jgi:hypothetical protein